MRLHYNPRKWHYVPDDPSLTWGAADDRAPILHEIREGLQFVFGERLLRRIVGTTATSNFFAVISTTLLPLFLLRELGCTPAAMGVVFSLGAVGGLLGAIATAGAAAGA